MKLILASSSAYRRMLLERLMQTFTTDSPAIDETPIAGESPPDMADRLALEKARAVAARHPGAIVIGSDQVAHIGDEIFGKPGNAEAAVGQLTRMSGQTVIFHTALAVINTRTGKEYLDNVPTQVRFRNLSRDEIVRYVDKEKPFDCAGSAKSEALGITLLDALSGDDPTALVGLPLIALSRILREQGMELP